MKYQPMAMVQNKMSASISPSPDGIGGNPIAGDFPGARDQLPGEYPRKYPRKRPGTRLAAGGKEGDLPGSGQIAAGG